MEGGEVDDDEDSFAGEEEGVGGELEVDACGEGDAGEVDGGGGDVLEFDEFFEVVVGGVVVDFGDDEVGGGGGFGGGGVGDGDVVGAGGVALVVEGGEGEGIGSGEEGDLDFEGLGVEPGEGERAAGAGDDDFFGVDPGGAGEGDGGVVVVEVVSVVAGDGEGDLGGELTEDVVAAAIDVAEGGGVVFVGAGAEVGEPRGEVAGVEGGADDVVEVAVVEAGEGGAGEEFCDVAISPE